MKNIKLLVVLLFPVLSFAQVIPGSEGKSKIELFSMKTGNLIKKEFTKLNSTRKVVLEILKISDVMNNTTIDGIKFNTTIITKNNSTETKSNYLDADEVDAFVKSAKFLLNSLNAPGDNYTEYQFVSRGGLMAGVYSSKSGWNYYLKLNQDDSDSFAFVSKEDFQEITHTVEQAKNKL
jgi:hypothetical protein